jgi:hypothetical protein
MPPRLQLVPLDSVPVIPAEAAPTRVRIARLVTGERCGSSQRAGRTASNWLRMRKEQVSRQDVLVAPRPFAHERFDLDRARAVIRTKIYPEIEGLTLGWKGKRTTGSHS